MDVFGYSDDIPVSQYATVHDFTDRVTYPCMSELAPGKALAAQIADVACHSNSALYCLLKAPEQQQMQQQRAKRVALLFDNVPTECVQPLCNKLRTIVSCARNQGACPPEPCSCLIRTDCGGRSGDAHQDAEDEACLAPGELNGVYVCLAHRAIYGRPPPDVQQLLSCASLCMSLEQRMQESMQWDDLPLLTTVVGSLVSRAGTQVKRERGAYPGYAVRKLRGGSSKAVDDMLKRVISSV